MKVLISLYKCYIKSWLQNKATIGSYQPYNYMFLFNRSKQWWSPFCPPESFHNKSPKTETALLVFEEETDWSISATLFCTKKTPDQRGEAWQQGPALPLAFRITYFTAEAESTAAAPGLWGLSPEFEALAATWRVGVGGWNSSTNFYKEFIDVYRIFCTGLYKNRMDGVGVILSVSLHDFSYIDKITLISCNGNYNIGWAVLSQLLYPIL